MFQLPVDDRISLVLAEERHARRMCELIVRNQQRLARWEPWAEQPQTIHGTRAYIRAGLEDFVRGRQVSTIIALERGTHMVGRCGLRINPFAASADVGYWVDGDYEGQGIVRRATEALIETAFRELGLNRVELRTSVGNQRSRRLAERLGFKYQGVLPAALRFAQRNDDVALYGIDAGDWRRR